ncbi:hypothetical protein ENUP19_0054G0044 [Entamoeba nuttalli]
MSEWNKISGNWSFEERDFSKWGKDRMKEIIQDPKTPKTCNYDGTFKVTKIEGDVFILVSHGQLKNIVTFDELKVVFASTTEGHSSGTAIVEVDNGFDYRFNYKTKANDNKTFEAAFKKMIEDNVVLLKEELKEKLVASAQ